MKISTQELSDFKSKVGSKCFIVKVSGEVNVFSSKHLKAAIEDILQYGNQKICVDLSDIAYLDSSGIAVFIGVSTLSRRKNSELILFGVSPQIDHIFEMVRVKPLFKIVGSVEEAVLEAARA
ncbi:STAS domain-containing protein [Leptospira tipperaryensis]|nr:STAS domain-containing protein [Leptospira tipperaryensis]